MNNPGISLHLLTFLVLISSKLFSIGILVDGHVYDQSGLPVEGVKVEFYNKTTMHKQTTDYTNSSGYYYANFVYTGSDRVGFPFGDRLFPNPSDGTAELLFESSK